MGDVDLPPNPIARAVGLYLIPLELVPVELGNLVVAGADLFEPREAKVINC